MRNYFNEALAAGCTRVVLLGTDSPNVPAGCVQRAFALLENHALVLGATEDGGYYLIGASGELPDVLAGVPWSSTDVWQRTMDNVERLGISCGQLPRWYDIDDDADLQRLLRDLAAAQEPALVRLREEIERQLRL